MLLAPTKPRRLSEVFRTLMAGIEAEISISDIVMALGDRSFAALLIFFSSLNLLPLPPGASVFLGLPIVIVSWQMVMGRHEAWLPEFILQKRIARERFTAGVTKLLPWLERLERFVKPRAWPIPRGKTDFVLGVWIFILAVAVVAPIPLGNWLPAFACTLLALSLSERDGVLLGIGTVVGIASLIIISIVLASAGAFAGWLYHAAI